MNAVRFAMFAERAVGVLEAARGIQSVSIKGMDPAQLREVLPAKDAAARDIAMFEQLLYPPDETVN